MSRHHGGPGRGPLAGSAALHVGALVAFWAAAAFRPEPVFYETFAVELFSPPPALEAPEPQLAPPPERLVIERPETAPAPVEAPPPVPPPPQRQPEPRPEPEPERRPDPPPEPRPQPTPTPPSPPPPEPERTPEPSRGPEARPDSPGGENLNVRMEGLRRDFPEYYRNIVLQIQRCFRWQGGGRWQTAVDFVITRDGQATGLGFASQSGNAQFDFEALGAVECAGRDGRFGPLPNEMSLDRLPVRFTFTPAGAGS